MRNITTKIQDLVLQYKSNLGEKDTETKLIEPLFELLGWNMRGAEVEKNTKVAALSPDYVFKINDKVKFVLEAKATTEKLDGKYQHKTFVEQAIEYAHKMDCDFAVLTNFREIRVYNANETFIQRPLFTLYYNEFAGEKIEKLWLLSKESFENNLLFNSAVEWGRMSPKIRLDERLLNDLVKFREWLSKDISENNQSKIFNCDETEFKIIIDEIVQKLLDRLIFIRNCEDRNIENKKIKELIGGQDIFKKLRKYFFKEIYDFYNSGIFNKEHYIDNTALQVSDEILDKVINGLYFTTDKNGQTEKYDFAKIESDTLGTVYEQYLSYLLRRGEKRTELRQDERQKKEQGIYYTPTYIVDYIVRNTLGELLKNKTPKQIEKIRLLDMACGSGSFLIKSYDAFEYALLGYLKNYEPTNGNGNGGFDFEIEDKKKLKADEKIKIIRDNLYGVDLDKKAVEIAQLNLLLKVKEKVKLPFTNIMQGNSLIECNDLFQNDDCVDWEEIYPEIMLKGKGGFDVIVGNPPYIDSETMVKRQPKLRDKYSQIYQSAKGNWDIFCLFLERGLMLLKPDGFLGMIVPNKLLAADYARSIRNYIHNYKIICIRDYSKIPVFNASVYPIVIIIQKTRPLQNILRAEIVEQIENKYEAIYRKKINQEDISSSVNGTWSHIFNEGSFDLLNKIIPKSKKLNEFATVLSAATVADAYSLKPLVKDEKRKSDYFKFINTGTIDRYSTLWGIYETTYIKDNYKTPVISKKELKKNFVTRYNQALQKKIIIGGMTKRLECYLDNGSYLAGKSTTLVISKKVNLKILLAILNSKLMSYLYGHIYKSLSLQGGYYRVGTPQIENLPIILPTKKTSGKLIQLVERITKLNEQLNKYGKVRTTKTAQIIKSIDNIDKKIDFEIYKLYKINKVEQKIIEDN